MPLIHRGSTRQSNPPGRIRRGNRRVTYGVAARQVGQHVVALSLHGVDANIQCRRLIQRLSQLLKIGHMLQAFKQPIRQAGADFNRQRLLVNLGDSVEPGNFARIQHLAHATIVNHHDCALNRQAPHGVAHTTFSELPIPSQIAQHVVHHLGHFSAITRPQLWMCPKPVRHNRVSSEPPG